MTLSARPREKHMTNETALVVGYIGIAMILAGAVVFAVGFFSIR